MVAKIPAALWADLVDLRSETRLIYLWLWTQADLIGAVQIRARQILLDTGLDPEWPAEALEELGRRRDLAIIAQPYVWLPPFILRNVGRGGALVRNRISKAMVKPFSELPQGLQAALLRCYPELNGILSPYYGDGMGIRGWHGDAMPFNQYLRGTQEPVVLEDDPGFRAPPSHGDSMGMASPSTEQSSTAPPKGGYGGEFPPNRATVRRAFQDRGLDPEDAEAFFAARAERNWMSGHTPLTHWWEGIDQFVRNRKKNRRPETGPSADRERLEALLQTAGAEERAAIQKQLDGLR